MIKLKNRVLKLLITILIIILIITITMIYITNLQYKEINRVTNINIAKIISKIQEEYPEVELENIIKILNKDDIDIEAGKKELYKYGIRLDEINSI